MKAFLSHSNIDKPFVEQAAKILGREYIVYDVYSFDQGADFRDEILRGLGKTNVFVFFVSRDSLASFYVDLELDAAQKKLFDQDISRAIAIRLDNSIAFDELPHWLRRTNAPFVQSAAIAARLIKEHVNSLKRESTPDILIGRTQDIARVEQALTPMEHRPPGIVALWGLPGIGRRAVAKRVLRDILDFQRALTVTIEAGDAIGDLRLKLAASLDAPTDSEAYSQLQRKAEGADQYENVEACLQYLEKAQTNRELVVLVDQGGLLDEDGELFPDFRNLLLGLFASVQLRTIIVSRRRPASIELESGLPLPHVRLDRLSDESTRTLLQQIRAREQVVLDAREIEVLVERVKGYPPAAYHAIGLIKDYGKELILRDAREIINFRETSFLRLLQKENKFSDAQRAILGLLPNFDALPLPVLGRSTKVSQEIIDRDAMRLVDLALVSIDDDGFYAISDPVREVTHKVFGRLDIDYEGVARAIDQYLAERQETESREPLPLSLIRAQYKAYVLAGHDRKDLFSMASDLIRVQQALYHDQDYERSIAYGHEALEIRRDQLDALKYIARALTQLEQYQKATETIDKIKKMSLKEAHFLMGFLLRKKGHPREAAAAYNEAIASGMKGAAVNRELGQCLFLIGNLSDARRHLRQALDSDPTNKFVLDYAIQVAIAEERFADARASIPELAQVEEEASVEHRLSTIESAAGNSQEAFEAAARAMDSSRRPHFEVIAQYVASAIRFKKLDEARDGLTKISSRFGKIRSDIQSVLWARYYLARGEVDNASISWKKIGNQNLEVHSRIREDILEFTLRNRAIAPDERIKLEAELDQLRKGPRRKGLEALDADLS